MSTLRSLEEVISRINTAGERIAFIGKNGSGKTYNLINFFTNGKHNNDEVSKIYTSTFFGKLKENQVKLVLLMENLFNNLWISEKNLFDISGLKANYKLEPLELGETSNPFQIQFNFFVSNRFINGLTRVNHEKNSNDFRYVANDPIDFLGVNLIDLTKMADYVFLVLFNSFDEPFKKMNELLNKCELRFDPLMSALIDDIKALVTQPEYFTKSKDSYFETTYKENVLINKKVKKFDSVKTNDEFIKVIHHWIKDTLNKSIYKSGDGDKWMFTLNYHLIFSSVVNMICEEVIPSMYIKTNFIIDEPESGLHETSERRLGKNLNLISNLKSNSDKTKTSVLIATHSRLIVLSFIEKVQEVIVTWKFGEKNTTRPEYGPAAHNESDISETAERLAEVFDKDEVKLSPKFNYVSKIIDGTDIDELFAKSGEMLKLNLISSFFYSNVILCEGVNDYILLDSLLLDERRIDTIVIAIHGKHNAITVSNILNSLGLIALLVVDSDVKQSFIEQLEELGMEEFKKKHLDKHNELLINEFLNSKWKTYMFVPNIESHFDNLMAESQKRRDVFDQNSTQKLKKYDFPVKVNELIRGINNDNEDLIDFEYAYKVTGNQLSEWSSELNLFKKFEI